MEILILRVYRQRNKLTQSSMAKKVGITQVFLSLLENGIRKPSKEIALSIEKATNGEIKAEWLVFPEKYEDEINEYLKTYSIEEVRR